MQIKIPEDVGYILQTLTKHGYEAYAVGGCVRDSILGREPHDWDITTNALPQQVKALFRRTIDTGIQHGTVTIMLKNEGYEVTTYRVDGDYSDGRHPDQVAFSSSLEEDLKRRDFTINAMAYNEVDGLVDLFGGVEDLEYHQIRCVGIPHERFTEDALRLLRAVRFSAQLGFSIEEHTAEAIRELAPTIAKVSRERIHTELGKILFSAHPDYIRTVRELGLLQEVLPEYMQMSEQEQDLTETLLLELKTDSMLNAELGVRYAMMLFPLGETTVKKAIKSLKLDNQTIDLATVLAKGANECKTQQDAAALRKQASLYGAEIYQKIEILCEKIAGTKALIASQEASNEVAAAEVERTGWIAEQKLFAEIVERGDALSIRDLALTGNDLISMGVQPGKEMGAILKHLLEQVLEDPTKNSKETLSLVVTNMHHCDTINNVLN